MYNGATVACTAYYYYISSMNINSAIKLTLCTAILLIATIVGAQRVTVSKEISIRNDYAYDIVGQVDDNLLLYRDKGNEKVMEVYDSNLKFLYDRELRLQERKASVYGVANTGDQVVVYSGYKKKGKYTLQAHSYNSDVQPTDTTVLIDERETFPVRSFQYAISADRSKTMLFAASSADIMHIYVVDNDSVHVVWWKEMLISDFDVRADFREAFVTDEGVAYIVLYDSNKESKKGEPQFLLISTGHDETVTTKQLKVNKKYVVDVECRYDQKNDNIVLAGLASDDREFDSDSYFFFTKNISSLADTEEMQFRNFDTQFIEEVYGKKLGRKKQLNDFLTRDVIVRNDGGILLVTEMEKEFFRRSNFNSTPQSAAPYGRGWVDLYNEDIIIVSINPDGTEHWKKILYKKQFAQDNDAVYSSFYIFKNPSQLRLIYNDEIKNNITVSEYVLNPLGRQERNSLLSTEYQNLKIRWPDAVQIGPSTLLVPSENNSRLSLVKVDYSEGS